LTKDGAMRSRLFLAILAAATLEPAVRAADFDKATWAYSTPRRPAPPLVRDARWVANPVDAFILARLEKHGLAPSRRADKLTLLRRVTFDLTGLPPTVAEQEAFLADDSPNAYEKVVDRLLASPHYGERWAQHWLDLVRYAESDGFKADDFRPNAYQYRDFVIQALNSNLPYDRFVRQQVAGDELEPDNPQALVATGFNRLWPYEYNSALLEAQRQEILDDVTEVTGAVFLGLTVGCARCHDHKFDPISQVDHFRLQAHFAGMRTRDDLLAADPRERQRYRERLAAWESATREVRSQINELTAPAREKGRAQALTKFRAEIQEAVKTPEDRRTAYQQVIALMAELQLQAGADSAMAKLPAEKKKEYYELAKKLAASGPKPAPPGPTVMSVSDIGRRAPPTFRLAGGDWHKPREEVQPGFLDALRPAAPDVKPEPIGESSGRRAALARWLTQAAHPLTARVMVNRLWQHHFGVGIVPTPSDFGAQGDPPTHPELLDWLAVEFMEGASGGVNPRRTWNLKHMHRLMVTSATYCQTSLVDRSDPRYNVDRDNKLRWHARRQRLEGETLRDAMLAVSGELNSRPFGPSARPKLPEKTSSYAWKPDARLEERHRRSVYVIAKRNMRFPMFDAFDLPDMHNSCARRSKTTTAPQALMLLNSDFALDRARHWCEALGTAGGDDRAFVAKAYRQAWGRPAREDELAAAVSFLQRQRSLHDGNTDEAAVDFCHALLNANEFLYVD
jgi:hypothetical protein